MKALSLTQPWATLIALGEKRIETRCWMTNYTGPLAIHASKGFPGWAKTTCEDEEQFYLSLKSGGIHSCNELPLGAVVCIVKLLGCRKTEDVRDQISSKEFEFGDYGDERFAWMLEFDRRLDEPIPAKGNRLLWNWTPPWDI